MTTSPDILERTFPAPPDSFERLVRRRARRERTRKIADGALALILVVLLVAALAGALALRRQRTEPGNGAITTANVGSLGPAWWSRPSGVGGTTQPILAGGHVYAIDGSERLRVYPVSCETPCEPTSTERIGPPTQWGWGAPVAAGDHVFVGTSNGTLLAYPISCGGDPSCAPDWSAKLGDDMSSASPIVADGVVYVASDARGAGLIGAYPETCVPVERTCGPLWTGRLPSGFLGSQPAVADGVVFVGSKDGVLSAFSTTCADDGGRCQPLWSATIGRGVSGGWSDTPAPITAAGSTVFVPAASAMYAYRARCTPAHGRCRPLWVAELDSWIDDTAVGGGSVFASTYDGAISVLPQTCGRTCRPIASIEDGGDGSPSVSGDLLYVAGRDGLRVFNASCGRTAEPCSPLWSSQMSIGGFNNHTTVAGDLLLASPVDGTVYAFTPGGSAPLPGVAAVTHRSSGWYGAFYGLLALAVIVWVVRRRRRRDAAPSPQT
ncbi:MAG TPA: PQQ-binding-like beta-propeller repeat protein [Actinomycetota bacterium]|nr:PQQ-binding-like beta-propeller repeat protein [Actinomycetota bacterium]